MDRLKTSLTVHTVHRGRDQTSVLLSVHLIKAEVSELLTTINLIDSVTLVKTNPSLSFSAPYFSFFFYKQENGYEGLQGKQSELWDIFKIQFNIPSVPSKYECMYHFF